MTTFTIGQVAERTGFSTSALRYYEELGLVAPATRTDAGYRIYDDQAMRRLAFIARAKQLGCSLDEITDLLGVWDGEECGPVQRRFHELVTDKLEATHARVTELMTFASQLRTAAARLDAPPIDGPCDSECACLAESETMIQIACTLPADDVPERLMHWEDVLDDARARVAMPDGRLRVEFAAGVDVAELASLAAAEQRCCGFFEFILTIDARGVALEIGAPDDASELVTSLFGVA